MKKILFSMIFVMAFIFTGCVDNEEGTMSSELTGYAPHIYGFAVPDGLSETRGVADNNKAWHPLVVQQGLTVKFLNGNATNKEFVIEAAQEWEKYANVKFIFVDDVQQNTDIRIEFSTNTGTSWSYTGTDNAVMFDKQNEPTMLLCWPTRGTSNVLKRSDALRAFGQVLGLELELRHPNFNPDWITNENDIKNYWENELQGFIEWEDVQKYIINPLSMYTNHIVSTNNYDSESVMVCPIFDYIANNIPICEGFDSEYNSVLSNGDIEIIQVLYGAPYIYYLTLIEYTYTGTTPTFDITTTEDIKIVWDENTEESTWVLMPSGSVSEYFQTVTYTYDTAKERSIKIQVEVPNENVLESSALVKFDITMGTAAKNIVVHNNNKALEYVRIFGGSNFNSQVFNFTGFESLEQLYLVQTRDSRAVINNCPKLEAFGTSRYIWIPEGVSLTNANNNDWIIVDSDIDTPRETDVWPNVAEWMYSLSNTNGTGLQISNCPELKYISLEHTRLTSLNFSNLSKLEYLYVSSTKYYICGGPDIINMQGNNLCSTLLTLKSTLNQGTIVVRGVSTLPSSLTTLNFCKVPMTSLNAYNIISGMESRNWQVIWESGIIQP